MNMNPKAQVRVDGEQVEIVHLFAAGRDPEKFTRYYYHATPASLDRLKGLVGKTRKSGRVLVDYREAPTEAEIEQWAKTRAERNARREEKIEAMKNDGTWPGRGW